ncbi:MAG: zf-HC2 domain-containing protein [Planctomycetota bacterium]
MADSELHSFHAGEMSEADESRVRKHLAECSDGKKLDDALVAEHAGMLRRLKKIDSAVVEASRSTDMHFNPAAGDQIGPYKLLETLGEGGFGVVYLAEQQEPILRRVALKIIKIGMDTRRVIARFEAERQALAMMDQSPHGTLFNRRSQALAVDS